jgi:hypothetical protein
MELGMAVHSSCREKWEASEIRERGGTKKDKYDDMTMRDKKKKGKTRHQGIVMVKNSVVHCQGAS